MICSTLRPCIISDADWRMQSGVVPDSGLQAPLLLGNDIRKMDPVALAVVCRPRPRVALYLIPPPQFAPGLPEDVLFEDPSALRNFVPPSPRHPAPPYPPHTHTHTYTHTHHHLGHLSD